jgi:16S rRNA pseudouridine516 synthase
MQLQDILFSQGFGPRRLCFGLVQKGLVSVDGSPVTDPLAEFDPQGLCFSVEGNAWTYREHAYVMMNKPAVANIRTRPACSS